MDDPEPIHIDPSIRAVLNAPRPSIEDIRNYTSDREVEWSSEMHRVENLGELIDVLQELQEEVGADAELRDWETGHSISVSARRYDTGETEVEL